MHALEFGAGQVVIENAPDSEDLDESLDRRVV
jgi:hypothetical protein